MACDYSGFDGSNDAADVYIFLPAAATGYGYEQLRQEYLNLTGPVPPLPDEAFVSSSCLLTLIYP